MITIKATTPEETKLEIAKYLNNQASDCRNKARIAIRKGVATKFNNQAEVLDFVAQIIKMIRIEQ